MENEQNFFALALNQADEKIAALDRQRESLQLQLDTVTGQKNILIATRRALRIQVGELPPDQPPLPQTSAHTKSFKGMGMAAAARKHLAEVGHAQTHAEILEALLKGNFKTQSKHPSGSLRTAMQKHPDWFRWVKRYGERGQWELVEWPIHEPNVPEPEHTAPTLSLVQ